MELVWALLVPLACVVAAIAITVRRSCRKRVPTVVVPKGTIGLVIAKAGAVRPPGSTLADFVECDSFQNGQRFLAGGGQRGRQQQVLTSGSYAIDPDLFEVITVNTPEAASREDLSVADLHEVTIGRAEIGVVVTVGGLPNATMVGPHRPGP